ncbi:Transmembrane amino acid transporter family protein [Perilla frutescens var. frutescens]|nr:Transmembrane amino acid transporter family protein [Perilla frutescens var. frutescens]
MQPKQPNDDVSLNIPFLTDYETCDHAKSKGVDPIITTTGTTSFFKTTFNGLNSLSGVGILSIPFALSCGGWLSLILLLIIAAATFYTGILIKRCMDVDRNIRSYPDIGDRAFGAKGRAVVSIFMNLELFLVATGFLILAGDNLQSLLPNAELDLCGVKIGGRETLVLLVALVMMPTVWIDNMTTLSYVSATGVVASVVILGSVLWSGIVDGIGFDNKGELLNWSGLPTALSLYAFCYCAHPVFPTLYTSMREKTQFSWVLLLCFSFCTVTYASMAVLGYLMFGSELQSQITLNLPTKGLSSKVAICTAMLNPIAKYALMMKPIVDWIESSGCGKRVVCCRSVARSVLVGSSVFVALTVPFFGYLMSLVGAFLSVTASVVVPCLCYLKICGNWRKLGCELVFISFSVVMGFVVMVVGTYTSLMQIVQNM